MQSHISCMFVSFPIIIFKCLLKSPAWIDAKPQELQICEISPFNDFQTFSQIAWLNRYKVTLVACVQNFSNMSQKLPPARFYSESSDFQNLSVFGDFYAFTVCHEIVHVSLCPLGFSVTSLSPFIKWLWSNDCFFSVIPIDSSLQQKLNT